MQALCRQGLAEGLTSGLSATRCWYVCDELSVWPISATTPSLHSASCIGIYDTNPKP